MDDLETKLGKAHALTKTIVSICAEEDIDPKAATAALVVTVAKIALALEIPEDVTVDMVTRILRHTYSNNKETMQ